MVVVPRFLHEVFGRVSTWAEILCVLGLGIGLTAVHSLTFGPSEFTLEPWRYWLGLVVAGDVYCGCIANFTRGTNDYYADSAPARWLFIAMHWHLIGVCALWRGGTAHPDFAPSLAVNALVLVTASVVNLCPKASGSQRFVGGAAMVCGAFLLALLRPLPSELMPVAVMFAIKVAYAFAVDHYHAVPEAHAKQP